MLGRVRVLTGAGIAAALCAGLFATAADAAPRKGKQAGKGPGKLQTREKVVSLRGAPGSVATAFAHCPRGTRAVGGGFNSIPVAPAIVPLVYESRRVGSRAWLVRAQQIGTGNASATTLTALVYCRSRLPQIRVRVGAAVIPDRFPVGSATAVATCPPKRRPVSGGFATPPGTAASAPVILRSHIFGNGWVVSGLRSAGHGPAVISAFTYCAPRRRMGVGGAAASGTIRSPGGSVNSPICRNKRRGAAGGGFTWTGTAGTGVRIFESRRAARGWRAGGVLFGETSGSARLTVGGYCS